MREAGVGSIYDELERKRPQSASRRWEEGDVEDMEDDKWKSELEEWEERRKRAMGEE